MMPSKAIGKGRRLYRPSVAFWATVLAFCPSLPGYAADALSTKLSDAHKELEAAVELININGKTEGLPDCVMTSDKNLFNRRVKESKATIAYTQVVIFEAMRQNEEQFRKLTAKEFVKDHIICKYMAAYRPANQARRNDEPRALAPMGSLTIEGDSLFAEVFHNNWGKHDLGHADATRAALLRLNKDAAFTSHCGCKVRDGGADDGKVDDTILISRASQTPDLYRWSGKWDVYHAHTDDFAKDTPPETQIDLIKMGQARFVKYVTYHAARVVTLAKTNAPLQAAFHMGIVAHMVQDLIYHHGISLRQHSGLAYLSAPKLENPDFPPAVEHGTFVPGSKAARQFDRATALTFEIFKQLLMKLGKEQIKAVIAAYVDEGGFNTLAGNVYSIGQGIPAEQDMNLFSLASYYSLHTSYEGSVEYGEQQTNSAPEREPNTHLVPYQAPDKPWNADNVGNEVKEKIGALD